MEQLIKDWANQMIERFNWLVVKYEYSKKYRTYIVSFSPSSMIDESEDFNVEAIAFNDKMVQIYGDDAPLFTDEEKLFKLTDNAQILTANSYSIFEKLTLAIGLQSLGGWNNSKTPATTYHVIEGVDTLAYDNIQFEIAA
ncbi:MAG: hypothetical protein IKX31_06375 [Muribaculaceae bacterium]|nr:hypothetical protein [Muribaculaceae bacterium]